MNSPETSPQPDTRAERDRCRYCGARLPVDASWCDQCWQQTAVFGSARHSRPTGGVHETIDWARVHQLSRVQATVTSFGWRGKLLLTSPPYLILLFWAYAGVFSNGALALGLGVPELWAAAWWTRQVWSKSRWLPDPPPAPQRSDAPAGSA